LGLLTSSLLMGGLFFGTETFSIESKIRAIIGVALLTSLTGIVGTFLVLTSLSGKIKFSRYDQEIES